MRIVFMGTPEFAVPALRQVANSGHDIVAVYTRAPKPGGRRGRQICKTPVHTAAEPLGLAVFTPPTLRTQEVQEEFRSHAADLGLVIAYGLLLPQGILTAPTFGCLNLHASLLPRWRGAAPIQRAIMAGDHETGVDLMRMEAGLDTGPIALREVVSIRPEDTAGELTIRLARTTAQLTVRALDDLESGVLAFNAQASAGVCYAHKIDKAETEIDWRRDAHAVRNHIHGLSPMPGAFSTLILYGGAERVKILRAEATSDRGLPGTILDELMTTACGAGAIRIREVQLAGRTTVSGEELMRRATLSIGAAFIQSETPSAEAVRARTDVRRSD